MQALFTDLSAKAAGFVGKVKAGDKVAVAASVMLATGAVLYVASALMGPSDSPKVMTPEQSVIASGVTVDVDGTSVKVTRVTKKDIAGSAATLAAGNVNSPFLKACGEEDTSDETRERSLRWLFSVLLKSTVPAGYGALCIRTESNNAVAIWFPRGKDINFGTLTINGAWEYVWRFSGWSRRGRWPGFGQALQARRQRMMAKHKDAFYYLLTAGAKPGAEGVKGLKAVIKAGVERAQADKQPCYAEATDSVTKSVLESLGFRAVTAESFSLFGVATTVMLKD